MNEKLIAKCRDVEVAQRGCRTDGVRAPENILDDAGSTSGRMVRRIWTPRAWISRISHEAFPPLC